MTKELILLAVVAFSFAFCEDCTLKVRYLLNNKNPLEESLWTDVRVSCGDKDNLALAITCPHENAIVKIYFANEGKNILVANLVGTRVRGLKYVTPHGECEEVEGPGIDKEHSKLAVQIPREWLPVNVTRMSASVEVGDDIHNYYGLFNYAISIADTMVVEEYKKLKCCVSDP